MEEFERTHKSFIAWYNYLSQYVNSLKTKQTDTEDEEIDNPYDRYDHWDRSYQLFP